MDVYGAVGVSVQLVQVVNNIVRFFNAVKDAPDYLATVYDEYTNLRKADALLLQILASPSNHAGRPSSHHTLIAAALLPEVQKSCQIIDELLVKKLGKLKNPRHLIQCIKTVIAKKEVEELKATLSDCQARIIQLLVSDTNLLSNQILEISQSTYQSIINLEQYVRNREMLTKADMQMLLEPVIHQLTRVRRGDIDGIAPPNVFQPAIFTETSAKLFSLTYATIKTFVFKTPVGTLRIINARAKPISGGGQRSAQIYLSFEPARFLWLELPTLLVSLLPRYNMLGHRSWNVSYKSSVTLPSSHEVWTICRENKVDQIQALYANGRLPWSVDICTKYGSTLLHNSCFHGCLDMIIFLLANGANLNALDCFGTTPMDHVLVLDTGLDIIQLLARKGGFATIPLRKIFCRLLYTVFNDKYRRRRNTKTNFWCAAKSETEAMLKRTLEAKGEDLERNNGGVRLDALHLLRSFLNDTALYIHRDAHLRILICAHLLEDVVAAASDSDISSVRDEIGINALSQILEISPLSPGLDKFDLDLDHSREDLLVRMIELGWSPISLDPRVEHNPTRAAYTLGLESLWSRALCRTGYTLGFVENVSSKISRKRLPLHRALQGIRCRSPEHLVDELVHLLRAGVDLNKKDNQGLNVAEYAYFSDTTHQWRLAITLCGLQSPSATDIMPGCLCFPYSENQAEDMRLAFQSLRRVYYTNFLFQRIGFQRFLREIWFPKCSVCEVDSVYMPESLESRQERLLQQWNESQKQKRTHSINEDEITDPFCLHTLFGEVVDDDADVDSSFTSLDQEQMIEDSSYLLPPKPFITKNILSVIFKGSSGYRSLAFNVFTYVSLLYAVYNISTVFFRGLGIL